MKAVILAAGRGKRMEKLTAQTPKPLLKIGGRPILEYLISNLPLEINEIVLVIGYLGDKIKRHFGSEFKGIKIDYVELKELFGTAHALWQTKDYLFEEKFLVVYGDDLQDKDGLKESIKYELALGIKKGRPLSEKYFTIDVTPEGDVSDIRMPTKEESSKEISMATGVFVLDSRIFNYEPVKLKNGEDSLPHTVCLMAKDYPVKAVIMDKWLSINYPEDVKRAEEYGVLF